MITSPPYRTPRVPVVTFAHVDEPATWPKAESAKCCIFEAINLIGSAKFGDEWTGKELLALRWPLQPQQAARAWQEQKQAQATRTPPPSPIPVLGSYQTMRSATRSPRVDVSPAAAAERLEAREAAAVAWATVVEREQAEWQRNSEALARLEAVAAWLAQEVRDSQLTSFYRFINGGEPMSMSAGDWNVEEVVSTFVATGGCQRWSGTNARPMPVYLFFDRKELSKALIAFAHAPSTVTTVDLACLSPLLRFAVSIALQKGYASREATPGTDIRSADVTEAWSSALPGVPMTKKMIDSIVVVTGFPDAVAIERGLKGGARKRGHPRNP